MTVFSFLLLTWLPLVDGTGEFARLRVLVRVAFYGRLKVELVVRCGVDERPRAFDHSRAEALLHLDRRLVRGILFQIKWFG